MEGDREDKGDGGDGGDEGDGEVFSCYVSIFLTIPTSTRTNHL
jgi:hypothetical protein